MLVLEGGLDPEYVLDKMQYYEVGPLLNQIHTKNKDIYEAARMLALVYAQSQTKKRVKASDLFVFPWDDKKTGDKTISNDDITRLKAKAKQQEKTLNNGKSNNSPRPGQGAI